MCVAKYAIGNFGGKFAMLALWERYQTQSCAGKSEVRTTSEAVSGRWYCLAPAKQCS